MTSVAKSPRLGALLLSLFFFLSGCAGESSPVQLSGGVFGTTWSLSYLPGDTDVTPEAVESALEAAFDVVNQQMNHYDPASEISRFNRLPAGEPMEVGWDFTYVLNEALKLSALTGGAYDTTVSPLSGLWGFGPEGPTQVPEASAIAAAKALVGSQQLNWQPTDRMLAKHREGVALDFSSIAKGYGVDLGADALDELGIGNYMFEIGGELRLRGMSPRGDQWRIAIERPDAVERGVQAALSVTDTGVATSGDYRIYFEIDGERFSHLVDPRTGYPIRHDLVSVTVVHPSTAIADAWATALIVLGYEAARQLADEQQLAVYFVRRDGDVLGVEWTDNMANYLLADGP